MALTPNWRVKADDETNPTFTAIDFPGSIFTEVNGINSRGKMVGRYESADSISHGYLLSDGAFATIDAPGAVFTGAIAINDRGEITGRYRTADGVTHGFLLSRGTITSIDFSRIFTSANGINNQGEIAGQYRTDDGHVHGFLVNQDGFTSFDFPESLRTVPFGINDEGTIVGWYISADNNNHGFALKEGEFTSFDFPSAVKTGAPEFPVLGINAKGLIVGSYCAAEPCPAVAETGNYENVHGYLWNGDEFISIEVMGSTGTAASAINSRRDIVGAYKDASGTFHGYLRSREEGGEEHD
jgi:uncharacterized membrane protein